ncbi:hypothetical protein L249_6960 [Ophiocordyceps polyrhachis-furcata BCC 54312]|uniref:Uncharacterized protein n=1 Tax=Ophiocordyceps polyrhachis-furcata BCC 54312 TaxID=1330021 RepID=A0A367LL21_9HYPO|nr:hypothetical protein L249_6960 [Ophiocordyceps polyrhachis-furcata BCC 54312]
MPRLRAMDYQQLTYALADAFNSLADEVQLLADRKTVLEHKLRFAHEQFQYLADKYAPSTPEIAETLAKLQLPPHTSVDDTSPVPLPQRSSPQSQHQLALVIRDGRRAASRLVSLAGSSKATVSSRQSLSHTSPRDTTMSTTMEQDFTVEGRKGNLQCPFTAGSRASVPRQTAENPHCAVMVEDDSTTRSPPAASKCPIRLMDKHSAAEIAHYVETHKHELPRSHEVCLRRYQKNEEQIRKLDHKYGNIVSMIEGLGHLHQPMLPEAEEAAAQHSDVDRASNERVETWAQAVSTTSHPEGADRQPVEEGERQARFDRPLKEVRVGESPSRPWGISVPFYEASGPGEHQPSSPPPAPVQMPNAAQSGDKCPVYHAKPVKTEEAKRRTQFGRTPRTPAGGTCSPPLLFQSALRDSPPNKAGTSAGPQMMFTGPVFIGYPMEQALQFLNQYQRPPRHDDGDA